MFLTTAAFLLPISSINKNTASVTFTVDDVSHIDYVYGPGLKNDPDGDSDGTTISIAKP